MHWTMLNISDKQSKHEEHTRWLGSMVNGESEGLPLEHHKELPELL